MAVETIEGWKLCNHETYNEEQGDIALKIPPFPLAVRTTTNL